MQDVSGMFHKREIGVRNDTYTRAEIDAKDGAIQAAADKAQATADGAVSVNNTQNTQIATLQKSAHAHSNKDVLDKTEQPYTTAERDKLSGLENYVHPAHTAYNKGMYKVAVDDEGHVTEAETMTKEDIYNAGGVIQSELTFQDYIGDIPLAFMTLFYGGGLRNIAEIGFDRRDDDGKRNFSLKLGGWQDKSTGRLDLVDYIGCQYTITPDPNNSYGTQHYYYVLPAGKSGTIALTSDIPDISEKQDKLTAGTNITISGNTISAKDTTYGNASASAAGLMSAADKKKLDGMDLSKYLPKSGGVMTGAIDMYTNSCDLLVGTHRSVSTGDMGTAIAGGAVDAKKSLLTGLKERKSIVGTYTDANGSWMNLISVRHRNGYGDGVNYGMYLISALTSGGNLIWNKQTGAGKWQGERVLLDSGNYTDYAIGKSATASAASKLSTARKINTVAFDGTSDIVIPRSTKYMNASSGTGGQTGYVKVATFTVNSQYTNMPTVVRYRNRHTMPVELIFRFKNQSRVDPELEFILQVVELTGYGYKEAYLYKSATSTWDLIIAKSEAWDSVQILDCQQADGVSVTFENTHVSTVPSTAIRATVYTRAMVTSTVAAANTLTDSGWVAMTVEGYAKSGTVKYRTYGKQITITGSVALKNDIATSYPAPQYIASTTFDFSKIVGCSGVGRSSSGVGAYVTVENYNGDNLVCVYALGSKIAAGATLYFTITGFID